MDGGSGVNARQTPVLVGGIVALAAALRVANVNAEFWFDEIVTVLHFVPAALRDIVSSGALANNHVMNSVLVHVSARVIGAEPWAVRLPAIAFAIAGTYNVTIGVNNQNCEFPVVPGAHRHADARRQQGGHHLHRHDRRAGDARTYGGAWGPTAVGVEPAASLRGSARCCGRRSQSSSTRTTTRGTWKDA